jgi:hypothetical protein
LPEFEVQEPEVLDPGAVLDQAGRGMAPPSWRVFTLKRSRLGGFLRGTSQDPDPLLVITPDGAVEYVSSRNPVAAVDFDSLARIGLQVSGHSFSDSTIVTLDVWLDLHYRDGRKARWRSASFADRYETVQAFIEAYGAHQTLRGGGLYPQ